MKGHEGDELAHWLSKLGYLTFVLDYNLEPRRVLSILGSKVDERAAGVEPAVKDGIAALRVIRGRAHEHGIDPSQIGLIGFSAGGHLACCICRQLAEDSSLRELLPLPKTAIIAYAPVRNPCCVCIVGSIG